MNQTNNNQDNNQNYNRPSIKLSQKQFDYSQGNRTCMCTGRNGIDYELLDQLVKQEHSQIVSQAIKDDK